MERADLPAFGTERPDLRGKTFTANRLVTTALTQGVALRTGHDRQMFAVEANQQFATFNVQILHGAFCVFQIVRLALHQSCGVHIHQVIGEQFGDARIIFLNQGPAAFLLKCQELRFLQWRWSYEWLSVDDERAP